MFTLTFDNVNRRYSAEGRLKLYTSNRSERVKWILSYKASLLVYPSLTLEDEISLTLSAPSRFSTEKKFLIKFYSYFSIYAREKNFK